MIDPILPSLRQRSTPVRVRSGAICAATRGLSRRPRRPRQADFGDDARADGHRTRQNVVSNAETMSMAGIQGKASVQQVVEAVMSAEQTLQGAVAIRDKVVAAYLEISRMQI